MKEISSNKQLKSFYASKLPVIKLTGETKARCGYFSECGGCALQNLSYDEQVALKEEAFNNIYSAISDDLCSLEVIPSPDPYYYRLRMDYVLSHHPIYEPNDRMGLRKKKNFSYVIDLESCHLIPIDKFIMLRKVFLKALELDIPLYDLKTGVGILRYLVIRTYSTDTMLSIVVKDTTAKHKLTELMDHSLALGFTSVYLVEQSELSDTSNGTVISRVGKEHMNIEITLDKRYTFMIGPNNFFQNNIKGFEVLMRYVIGMVKKYKGDSKLLYDIYGGVGTIGILLSKCFQEVVTIESDTSNVSMIDLNAKLNNVNNVKAVLQDAREHWQISHTERIVAIVDPPRTGLMSKGVDKILTLSPSLLVYISCNPVTQKADLQTLLNEYDLLELKGFDMFPQTLHLESVAILRKKSCKD